MSRLSVVDEIFLRTHRGMGIPVAMQGIWLTDLPVDPARLDEIDARIAHGSLGLRIVTPRIPGARRRWVRAEERPGVVWTDRTDDPVEWAATVTTRSLDPEFGPGWQLSAAPTGAGTVISLACTHVIADARGLIAAAAAALIDDRDGAGDGDGADDRANPLIGVDDPGDVADAVSTLSTVVGRTTLAVAGLAVDRDRRSELTRYLRASRSAAPKRIPASRPQGWTPRSITVDVSAARWDDVAASGDGTPNVLFLQVVAAIVARLRCGGDGSVLLGVPMKVEAKGANALSVTAVRVTPDQTMAQTRSLAKNAYRSPLTGPAGFPDELLHVVPPKVASVLAPSTGQRDALCSNIGTLPDQIRSIAGRRAVRVAARAIHPGLEHRQAAGAPTILSAYLCRGGEVYTLSVVVTDPERAHARAEVRDAVDHALTKHDLVPDFW